MKVQQVKKEVTGYLNVIGFVIASGLIYSSTARARGGQQLKPPPNDGCLGCSREGDSRLGNERDRIFNRQQEMNREEAVSSYGDSRRREFERHQGQQQDRVSKSYVKRLKSRMPQYQAEWGYRDGLDRGKEDVRKRRTSDPNNSSHYRKGTEIYREAFRRGYDEGYRQPPVK
jgi:hypothetical protein